MEIISQSGTIVKQLDFEFSRVGMVAPEQYLTFTQWQNAGQTLKEQEEQSKLAFAWCWGDWIAYARNNYGEDVDYMDYAAAITGKSLSTLLNYAWVAGATPTELRGMPNLYFRHYLEAIRLKDIAERHALLQQASKENWTKTELCDHLPEPRSTDPKPATTGDKLFELEVTTVNLEQELVEAQSRLDLIKTATAEAVEKLAPLADQLPDDEASIVRDVMQDLNEVIVVPTEFVQAFWAAVELYRQKRYGEVAALMEQLAEIGQKIMPRNTL